MKKVPVFKTDAEAEAFLAQDLSDLDFSQFKPQRFHVARKEPAPARRNPPQTAASPSTTQPSMAL